MSVGNAKKQSHPGMFEGVALLYTESTMIKFHINGHLSTFLSRIATFLLFSYIAFLVGKVIWLNWQLHREISQIEQQISELKTQQKDLENLVLYYQSDSYREIEARRKLGLKKNDEIAIAIPSKSYQNYEDELQSQKQGVAEKKSEETVPNRELWYNYFFN